MPLSSLPLHLPKVVRRRHLLLLTLLAVVSATVMLGAAGAPRTQAQGSDIVPSFDWSMPDRLADHDGDGTIDSSVLSSQTSGTCEFSTTALRNEIPCHADARAFVSGLDGFTVNFNACASTGAIASYRWHLDGVLISDSPACDGFSQTFPREGVVDVMLEVVPAQGGEVVSLTQAVPIQDWLIIALGDSYGSGEGAPDEPSALYRFAQAAGMAWDELVAAVESVGNDCLAFLDAADVDTFLELGDSLLSDGFDGFLDTLDTLILDPAQKCGTGFSELPGDVGTFFVDMGDAFAGAFGEDVFDPITSLGLTDLLPNPIAEFSARIDQVFDNIVSVLDPVWQEAICHRSANSGQVQAALELEQSDPRTSVTLVHLACSGATIGRGILGSYADPPGCDGCIAVPPQINDAAFLVGDREIDVVLVSIGGNDIGFSKIITACIAQEPCSEAGEENINLTDLLDPLCEKALFTFAVNACQTFVAETLEIAPVPAPLIADFGSEACTDDIVDCPLAGREDVVGLAATDADGVPRVNLSTRYADLDKAIQALLVQQRVRAGGNDTDDLGGRIFITEYPNATRDDQAQPCAWDSSGNSLLGFLPEFKRTLPFISEVEFLWAEGTTRADGGVTDRLNQTIASAARNHGWTVVDVFDAFETHGYCADDHWVVRLHETFLKQLDESGAVHPNEEGYAVQGAAIATSLKSALYGNAASLSSPRVPATPPELDVTNLTNFPVFGPTALTDFGSAVDIDGDLLVVGDPMFGGGGSPRGAAYIYRFNSERYVLEHILEAPAGARIEKFGLDVGVSGDTVVVATGGQSPDNDEMDSAIYIYRYRNGTWDTTPQTFPGSDEAEHAAVAIDADIIVVGTPRAAGGIDVRGRGTDTGGIRLYFNRGSVWVVGPALFPNMPQYNCIGETLGFFGWDLDVAGSAIVVGSPRYGERVYLLREMRSGIWMCVGTTIAAGTGNPGWSVGFDGRRAILGSPLTHSGDKLGVGSVFIFRDAGALTPDFGAQAAASSIVRDTGDLFGDSVAIRGDQIVIGAYLTDAFSGQANAGGAYLLNRVGTEFWQASALRLDQPADTGATWGDAVAIGARGIAVSAPGQTQTDINSGVVMVFRNEPVQGALIVNSMIDEVDVAPGDGICATADGLCTLRAAVQEANERPGADAIAIPAGAYSLTLTGADEQFAASGDLDVRENLTSPSQRLRSRRLRTGRRAGAAAHSD